MKVIVGMSGGVDSSVAAYLLREEGYEVEGVSFILEERRIPPKEGTVPCCSFESILDAEKTAERIGIRHTIVSLRNEFSDGVIDPFIEAYLKGLTPNPCILCNERIKFPFLLKVADERGADGIATGHYARVMEGSLLKGLDAGKDQSYVLYVLKPAVLGRLVLPLGERRKDEVREIARRLDLPSAKRPESQEICFVGGKGYHSFFEGLSQYREGPVVEWGSGKVLGTHRGIHGYTIGQRKRLGIAADKPLFVIAIDPLANTVRVGPRECALAREFSAAEVNWLVPQGGDFRATVKVRSMMRDEPATVTPISETAVHVLFDEPQWAPAPGQSAVFYQGDRVVGGGIISKVLAPPQEIPF